MRSISPIGGWEAIAIGWFRRDALEFAKDLHDEDLLGRQDLGKDAGAALVRWVALHYAAAAKAFMGSRAFEYYLPVIDRYLHEVTGGEESDGCQAAILGSGVAAQFDWKDSELSRTAVGEIEELSVFVRANLTRFSPEPEEQRRIDGEWKVVDERIARYGNRSEQA